MKKLFLLVALSALTLVTHSCSKDDTSDRVIGTISMKINGVAATFTKIHLIQTKSPDGQDTSLAIYTEDDGDDYGDMVSLTLMKGIFSDIGSFSYSSAEEHYSRASNFVLHLTSNGNDKKVIGTFSGDVTGTAGNLSITEGTLSIQY